MQCFSLLLSTVFFAVRMSFSVCPTMHLSRLSQSFQTNFGIKLQGLTKGHAATEIDVRLTYIPLVGKLTGRDNLEELKTNGNIYAGNSFYTL